MIEPFHFEQLNLQGSVFTDFVLLHLNCQIILTLSNSVLNGLIRVVVASAASSALRPTAMHTAQ
jgi:hypothetical protein